MRSRSGIVLLAVAGPLLAGALSVPAGSAATPDGGVTAGLPRSAELSETTRLADRRSVVLGDRFYSVGTEDGLYPAQGWHTLGEMGGFWSPPIKLLDGMWFGIGDAWLGRQAPATRFTSGWGYTRTDFAATSGVRASRTDLAPDGLRAGLTGLTLSAATPSDVSVTVAAHSELTSAYPWGWTTPSQSQFNLPDTGDFASNALVFRDQGTPPVPNAAPHDYAAVVGSSLPPRAHQLGPDFRGPQSPPVVCPATGATPDRCDDSAFGKGTGGSLTYRVHLDPGRPTTLWFAVAGSDQGLADARANYDRALADPAGLLAAKLAKRQAAAARSTVDLPGDPLLARSVAWAKQNLADAVQESHNLQLRPTSEGKNYPAAKGTLPVARWIGAGWPDYPWLFGTDGEYTAFASVAAGQFDAIESHLRTLQRISDTVNDRSGKVVHEVTPDGSVYFGTNDSAGNTDETAKFPSAVALVWRWTGDNAFRDEMYDFTVRNMRYVTGMLDADHDGWPEGSGNVERPGMGPEKLDNAVYTIRGLRDLADLARSRNDTATESWATARAADLEKRFDTTWWAGGDTNQYGDSLAEPNDAPIFQRHWIGVTPMDAELARPGQPTQPLAPAGHGNTALDRRQQPCYSGEFGLYHTGTGPTSDPAGNPGPSCDSAVSTVASDRTVYGIGTGIMAVAEGNYGRMGGAQQQRYTTANARAQLDPSVWEMPGAMPEVLPSPDFGANIDRKLTERSMVLQAWDAYGILWPVVHQQLGVSPDMGRGHVDVVPRIPDGQQRVAGNDIRLGDAAVDVLAEHAGQDLRTTVTRHGTMALTIGQVLPAGASVASVTLDGHPVAYRTITTTRGTEIVADAGQGGGRSTLVVRLS
ncbi:hypothetical protein [Gandjariella thermophila]|uniref:Glycogen debranching protein n=1 Tax=Gandjariella thermophila TaxID=1931992 RepID=A0A4D4J2F5_9PSEU|nr:hypothetical protein [Gandjariella thermophila]GDY28968.1 hypothetical protein GTS_06010 [Gandjariella thermophila]